MTEKELQEEKRLAFGELKKRMGSRVPKLNYLQFTEAFEAGFNAGVAAMTEY